MLCRNILESFAAGNAGAVRPRRPPGCSSAASPNLLCSRHFVTGGRQLLLEHGPQIPHVQAQMLWFDVLQPAVQLRLLLAVQH